MKAYVYAPLPKSTYKFFPDDRGGDDDSAPHCTVLFIGEIADSNVDKLKSILDDETKNRSPIGCHFGELKSFPAGDYGVPWYVEIVADSELERLHKTIWRRLTECGIPVEHSWKEFKPHATLKYLPEGADYDGAVPEGEFTMDSILLDIQERI